MIRKTAPLLLIALLVVLSFWKALFHPEFTLLTGNDMCAQTYPWFSVTAHYLHRGILPLWDPYVYGGKPMLGELQPGVLYPLNWIFQLFPRQEGAMNLRGLELLIIAHYFLATFFMYLLARSFALSRWASALAGVAFMLGGYSPQIFGYVNIFSGFVWMPLILLFFRKATLAGSTPERVRWVLWAGVCMALSLLAGHHVPPVHTGLLLMLYSAAWIGRDWKQTRTAAKAGVVAALAGVGACAVGLTALQWLPSAEWAARVWRWVGDAEPVRGSVRIPYSVLERTGNLSPEELLTLVNPFLMKPTVIYVGAPVLFLVLMGLLFGRGRGVRFFGGAAVFYLFVSLGGFSALHGWLNTFVPGMWFAREVYHFLVPLQLCLAMLAGWGWDAVLDACATTGSLPARRFIRRAGWTLAMALLALGTLMVFAFVLWEAPIANAQVRGAATLFTYMAILVFLLFQLHTGRMAAAPFRFFLFTLVLVDLASYYATSAIRTVDRPREGASPAVQAYWKKPPAADFLIALRKGEVFRVDDPEQIFPLNYGDVWRLESTMGHGATAMADYLEFRGTGWGPASNATALLNVRYFVSRIPVPGMVPVLEGPVTVYRNPRAVPRAFVARRFRAFSERAEMLRWLQSPLMAPAGTALLEAPELERLPAGFLDSLTDEREDLPVRIVTYQRAAEKEAERASDEEERKRLNLFGAPWGWSAGDDVTLGVEPARRVEESWLVLSYTPTRMEESPLIVVRERPGERIDIPVRLPGLSEGEPVPERPRRYAVPTGSLEAEEYRISLETTDACSARIESVQVTGFAPEAERVREDDSVELVSLRPNRLLLRASLRSPGLVVVSEVMYPGWEARVDGRPAPVLTADSILRAVPVEAGDHEIELLFRPQSFRVGAVVSLVFGAGVLGCLIWSAAARRRSGADRASGQA